MQQEPKRKKQIKSKKITSLDEKQSRNSIKSDNLHIPLTPSTFRKSKTSDSRPSTAKSSRSVVVAKEGDKKFTENRKFGISSTPPSDYVPKNVAVHFTSFYENQDRWIAGSLPHSADEKQTGLVNAKINSPPKMEFTRQMVYRLENSAGTQNYGKQVSALLEDTVESPDFDLKLPPIDNCAPNSGKANDVSYPLWYKDPNKMPQISSKQFRELKERYQEVNKKRFENAEVPNYDSNSETKSELESSETESDSSHDENNSRNCSSANMMNNKVLKKSLQDLVQDSISKTNCSSISSLPSTCETETDEELKEEDSISWETTDDEDSKVKLKVSSVIPTAKITKELIARSRIPVKL